MKTEFRILGVILSLAFMLFSFNHCVISQQTASKKSTATQKSTSESSNTNLPDPVIVIETPTPSPTPDVSVPDAEVIQAQTIDIGIKNFEQINETMSVLTGVNTMTNSVSNTYEDLEVQLPTDNSIKSFLSANQVAITKLAAEYCDELVDSGALRAEVWPGLDFGRGPSSVLNSNTQKFNVIDQTLNKFWGVQVGGSRNTSQTEMFALMTELLNGENLNNSSTTRTTIKGICTAALASAQVTLL